MAPRRSQLISDAEDLGKIGRAVAAYCYLPFASDSIPGAYVEAAVANVRGGEVLRTYDFVDVVDRNSRIGWQVKSTKEATPVTWKRAKIPSAQKLIAASRDDDETAREEGLSELGKAIISFCNRHGEESLEKYDLEEIGFSRVLVTPSQIVYYERKLLDRDTPEIFNPADFTWRWSVQKEGTTKEQLSALHGRRGGEKWFAWHGLGENQLHFSGERFWWPEEDARERIALPLPSVDRRMDFVEFVDFVTEAAAEIDNEV